MHESHVTESSDNEIKLFYSVNFCDGIIQIIFSFIMLTETIIFHNNLI